MVNQLIKEALFKDIALIDKKLSQIVKPGSRLTADVYKQVIESGKRLRPLIVLYSAFACGFDNKDEAVLLGSIVELIHTASLLHDDIVDGSTHRRGRESANVKFGVLPAVLGGDYLYSLAYNMVLDFDKQIAREISRAAYMLAEGEIKEIEIAYDATVKLDDYYDVIYKKTAVLLEASAVSGALLAASDYDEYLEIYGRNLGFAFQIRDDCLDYMASLDQMGKDTGVDLKEGKVTLPVLYAMQEKPDLRELLCDYFTYKNDERFEEIFRIVKRFGLEKANMEASMFSERAKAALRQLPESNYRDYLEAIADYAVERER